MKYNHNDVEPKWIKKWQDENIYAAEDFSDKPKYYVLDMFPYPSGAGLHVGHPLGYIASDIYARYKRHQGYNVLHPMGYDSFGLPAEQYAIQTGQHPEVTTKTNIDRYRNQLDRIGFSFDWSREVRTSNPDYYKWTQWIFKQLFNSWYNNETNKAENINTLVTEFEKAGNAAVNACTNQENNFTATDWKNYSEFDKNTILQNYRLAYLADSEVNWCAELGTVLANDEIKDGVSERGGHPVIRKKMTQWVMRITAYADRLLKGLNEIDWSDSLKEQQTNWIGKSNGASLVFDVVDSSSKIEIFTTRPDTIFGVSFMVLAPEHELVNEITSDSSKEEVLKYQEQAALKSERDRQSNVKTITGAFTGAYVKHPFTKKLIPVYISDYVLAGYGTGAIMAVPAGDQRDWSFAKHFKIDIPEIFEGVDLSKGAYEEKGTTLKNSDFLNGLTIKKASQLAIEKIEIEGFGAKTTNFRLRDAVFSRQRYWGEPFPVYYENGIPKLVNDDSLPVVLPPVDAYLPTKEGEPPLARAKKEDWNVSLGDHMEYNTMPGWAGSSWYFLRYMDPKNSENLVSKEAVDYWNQVDLYIGGSEHATGHLLYARFWTKFLYDISVVPFEEPFKKLINQGMILGRSSILFRDKENPNTYVSKKSLDDYHASHPSTKKYDVSDRFQQLRIDIHLVDNDILDTNGLKSWQKEYEKAEFYPSSENFLCGYEVEKMSKRWFNVEDPSSLCEKYGADTLRCYEMFLGPLEQSKPWDVQGINGVNNFLKKLWRLFHVNDSFFVSDDKPTPASLKTLHKTIKKITEDLERYSFNTPVSAFMICVNELTEQKCNSKEVLKDLLVLLSPYAPFICEELWSKLGSEHSITSVSWPTFNSEFLKEAAYNYPVSFNGKMRFKLELPTDLTQEQIKEEVLTNEQAQKWLEGKEPKKVIVVPKKIVNVVI